MNPVNYSFQGKATRMEYLITVAVGCVIAFIISMLSVFIWIPMGLTEQDALDMTYIVFVGVLYLVALSVGARRLRDMGAHAGLTILHLIPYVGWGVVGACLIVDSKKVDQP